MKVGNSKFKLNANGTFSLKNDNSDNNNEFNYAGIMGKPFTEKLRDGKREKGLMCRFCNSTLDLIKVRADLEGEQVIKICGDCIEDFNVFEVEYEILERYDGEGNVI